ncbi:2Fe-2S iron-sulfur cluster-binding family protein [Empedobacter sedimenti]|uniref:2Fe-2S iron-sulfur cluster-binding protein n=1 Tax=Empedobacter sedimenti TaxID=3042610 RepID=UPI0024A6E7A1|nr:2Fe-2S iron-sulfur cluster-binding protein [Empedobacter sedimenti]
MKDIILKITDREGVFHEISAPTDMAMSVMEIIRAYELVKEGTFGVCGGMLLCATCQCYMDSEDIELPEKSMEEDMLLDDAYHVKSNSRLSCQLSLTEILNGLQLTIAPEQ